MRTLSKTHLNTLCEDVQFNCSISDARFAQDYSLCIYLLRMREFYRWRFDIPLMQKMSIDTVGDWISEMEMQWDDIEDSEFKPLNIDNETFDMFDSDGINKKLVPTGLIYSAGLGRMGQPHFMLAELKQQTKEGSIVSFECGKELARDSITMPAMTQNRTIYIRHDSIKRQLWQMIDEWQLQKKPGPMARLVEHFQLTDPLTSEQQLDNVSVQLSALYQEHERGEVAAGELLGERYSQLLLESVGTRGEFYLRAVRDLLADSLTTWPYLLNNRSEAEFDFWLASLTGARLKLLKTSGLYGLLQENSTVVSRFDRLANVLHAEQARWQNIAQHLITSFEENPQSLNIETESIAFLQSTPEAAL